MSRFLRAAVLLLFVSACGSSNYSAPRNLDDACSIVSERPSYFSAMKRAERRWGVPVAVQMATIYQESKFIGNARTPVQYSLGVIPMGRQSSAYGYSQALGSTWKGYKKSAGRYGADRDDFGDAIDFIGWYNYQSYKRSGIRRDDAYRLYLAYHEGHGGYNRGTYRKKSWLTGVARKVDNRAGSYGRRLQTRQTAGRSDIHHDLSGHPDNGQIAA